ncbi:MAG TPA: hypothetical protein VMU51_32690 [Mycobacteriales bacterium]|nr:hypothetical protein [Mycobacteriales bacterium]
MGRTALRYTAILVGAYIAVAYASGAGVLLTKGSQGASGFVKTLQGR